MNVPDALPSTHSSMQATGCSDALSGPGASYFEGDMVHSPDASGSNSDTDSDSNSSQTTLEDVGIYARFGHPLERVVRKGSTNGEGLFEGTAIPQGTISRSSSIMSEVSNSSWSSTSSIVYDIDYEKLIDDLLEQHPTFDAETPNMMFVEPSSPEQRDSLMIKCLPRTSDELFLVLELNHKDLRSDPWNPVPHLRCAVERKDNVYLCMERLHPYDEPPFKTVANYIDFFRQMLEGLTFLHELKIGNLSFHDPTCYMVDLSSAPSTCPSPSEFDRTKYPVRYYFTNLNQAVKYDTPSDTLPSALGRDVRNCGTVIERLLAHVPRIEPKIKSLVRAMTGGGYGAEDARKLFEALCKSFEAQTLEAPSLSSAANVEGKHATCLLVSA